MVSIAIPRPACFFGSVPRIRTGGVDSASGPLNFKGYFLRGQEERET